MAKARVVPGVQVEVIQEIVPQQLYPSGVVGMIGTADKGIVGKSKIVTSFQELKDEFLDSSAGSLIREGKSAFQNGVFQIVAVRVAGSAGNSTTVLTGRKNKDVVRIVSKGPVQVPIEIKVMKGMSEGTVRVEVLRGSDKEEFENLDMNPSNTLFLPTVISQSSKWISAESILNEPNPEFNPSPQEVKIEAAAMLPPSKGDYERALEALELETNVDVVYVCENSDKEIQQAVIAHCEKMSSGEEPKPLGPRIGVGTVGRNESVEDIVKRVNEVRSDRFVLVAPYGAAGAVAGLLSKLNYFESPTFKQLNGITELERRYTPSEQMTLLQNGVMPIDLVKGRGNIVVKGINTTLTKERQVSVIRIQDHATRGIASISELFIGNLNNERNRGALRERITEFMIAMEKEGAIVPTVDNTKPAFVVDVYSSQADFSQGIVRVNSAVRPVRAMDYVYATIFVQAF